ncbi:MAG: protein translocase subunit SecD [Clostridia bacterium]|nr:protein translocase subunit SecD [Clostridia bacterium]
MANKNAKPKNPRTRAVVSLVAILIVVAVAAYVALFGVGKGTMINYLKPWGEAISLGLDLRGGVYTVYQAEDDGSDEFETKMSSTVGILTSRLTRQGFTEATVTRQGTDRIRVEIPNVSDPNEILRIIGTPAQLYFVDEDGNNIMEGSMVKNAQAAQDENGRPCVAFELNDEGAKIFAEATAANLGKTISITLDGETISTATVNSVIAGGRGEITSPNFTTDEVKNLSTLILSGALPLNLTQLEVSAISATLGVEALDRAIQAGIIGVALVMIFMIFRYRLCGVVADIALTVYIMIVVLLLALTGAQLTLPGVAGIILGIGMAVDANVVIFERIREEVAIGRPLASSIKKGFSNALSAIIDANITTIIAAVVLYAFGTGTIRGFALTLGIGVATSMFTAVFVTHKLLDIFADLGIKNQKLYVR